MSCGLDLLIQYNKKYIPLARQCSKGDLVPLVLEASLPLEASPSFSLENVPLLSFLFPIIRFLIF